MNLSNYNLEDLNVLLKLASRDVEFYNNKMLETNNDDIDFSILQSRLQSTQVTVDAIKQEISSERF